MTLDRHHGRLCAESLAAPLCQPAGFADALITLRRADVGVLDESLDGATHRLANDLADWLRLRAEGASLDALRAARDHVWFPEPSDAASAACFETPLHALFGAWAEYFLEMSGGGVALGRDGPERTAFWRQVSLALPPDLLVAARLSRGSSAAAAPLAPSLLGSVPERVELVSAPLLRTLIDEPVAETHLHVGSSIPFEILWTSWMLRPPTPPKAAVPADPVLGDARAMARWLRLAAIARSLLARALQPPARDRDLAAWMDAPLAALAGPDAPALRDALDELVGASARRSPAKVDKLFRSWLFTPSTPRTLDDFLGSDPLGAWWPYRGGGLTETRFCVAALQHLAAGPAPDTLFARAFWQYQRVRCRMYRYLIEESGTEGLEWFTAHFDRIWALRGAVDPWRYAVALRTQSQGVRLGALEARTAPSAQWSTTRDELRRAARNQREHLATRATREGEPEFGVVLHFLKERLRGPPSNIEHGSPLNLYGYRYASLHRRRVREARAVAKLLRLRPGMLYLLRGLDVASRELDAPTWVFALPIAEARDASRDIAIALRAADPRRAIDDLRVTLHAGEDFRTLVQGLRRVHEGIESGMLRRGDRIGHGLALGTDPAAWRANARGVVVPREELLDDVLWQLDRHAFDGVRADASRLAHLAALARKLGREIYDVTFTVEDLREARRALLRPEVSRSLVSGGPSAACEAARLQPNSGAILYAALTDLATYRRAREPIFCNASGEDVAALRRLQRWLCEEVARLALTIEVNPSSNLVVGRLDGVHAHPAFRMRPLHPRPSGAPLIVSVNTDNPLTFSSCLGDEFALLYDALLGAGASADEALAWLSQARLAGYRSRFTLPASTDDALLATL